MIVMAISAEAEPVESIQRVLSSQQSTQLSLHSSFRGTRALGTVATAIVAVLAVVVVVTIFVAVAIVDVYGGDAAAVVVVITVDVYKGRVAYCMRRELRAARGTFVTAVVNQAGDRRLRRTVYRAINTVAIYSELLARTGDAARVSCPI